MLAPRASGRPRGGWKCQASARALHAQRSSSRCSGGRAEVSTNSIRSSHICSASGIDRHVRCARQPAPDVCTPRLRSPDACSQCTRCVRACARTGHDGSLRVRAGNRDRFDLDDPMVESTCVAWRRMRAGVSHGALAPSKRRTSLRSTRSGGGLSLCGVCFQLTLYLRQSIVRFEGRDGPAITSAVRKGRSA